MIFHPLEWTRNDNDPRAETRSAPESVGLSADENLPPIPASSQGCLRCNLAAQTRSPQACLSARSRTRYAYLCRAAVLIL